MLQRFIDGTALLSIEWTVQKLDNVDRTHLPYLVGYSSSLNSYRSTKCPCMLPFYGQLLNLKYNTRKQRANYETTSNHIWPHFLNMTYPSTCTKLKANRNKPPKISLGQRWTMDLKALFYSHFKSSTLGNSATGSGKKVWNVLHFGLDWSRCEMLAIKCFFLKINLYSRRLSICLGEARPRRMQRHLAAEKRTELQRYYLS